MRSGSDCQAWRSSSLSCRNALDSSGVRVVRYRGNQAILPRDDGSALEILPPLGLRAGNVTLPDQDRGVAVMQEQLFMPVVLEDEEVAELPEAFDHFVPPGDATEDLTAGPWGKQNLLNYGRGD